MQNSLCNMIKTFNERWIRFGFCIDIISPNKVRLMLTAYSFEHCRIVKEYKFIESEEMSKALINEHLSKYHQSCSKLNNNENILLC
jgi:hypothetical protein